MLVPTKEEQAPSGDGATKGDRTRQALLGAAVVRFAREGFRGTSVADVCRDAGLSTTASYPYFANKEAIFVAAVDEDVARLIDDAVSFVAMSEDAEHWARSMMQGLLGRLIEHPLAGRILRGLEPDFTMRLLHIPALEELRKSVAELIRVEQVEGAVRRDIDPAQTANGMVLIVISLLMAATQIGAAGIDQTRRRRRIGAPRRHPPAPLTRRREPIRGA